MDQLSTDKGVSMKRILSLTLAASMLVHTTGVFAANAVLEQKPVTSIQRADGLQSLVNQFKHDVYANGQSVDAAIKKLSSKILEEKYSITDLQLFVQMNAEPAQVQKFNQTMDIALSGVKNMEALTSEELSFILKNAMVSTNQTGANFMSCTVGLGIGVPLVAVGVIIGIIALVNATASKELVTKDYVERRNSAATQYLNTKADLELEITTYESDIIFYQDEIAELQRQISSGNYGAIEMEKMQQTIREYEFLISDARALIGEVKVDLDYYAAKFETDSETYNKEELAALGRVDERKANAGKQAIVAGVAAALGSVFVFGSIGDCT